MTLIVGIRCTDGVVVAADSAVTFGSGQSPTISDTQCKISIIDGRFILAGTGQVGLGQRCGALISQLWSEKKLVGLEGLGIAKAVCAGVIQDYGSTGAPKGQYGALLAFSAKRRQELCEFALADFQPEMKTDSMWYASMGSGQSLADPYLRLMRTVFWQDGPPNLQDGKFAAMWVVTHAIEAAPGFIGKPISMAVLEKDGSDFAARMLDQEELLEHEEHVEAATKHFRQFREETTADSIPAPSPPSSTESAVSAP